MKGGFVDEAKQARYNQRKVRIMHKLCTTDALEK